MAKNDWTIGRLSIEKPLIFYETSGLENLDFNEYPYKFDGVVGNAGFYDDYIPVFDSCKRKKAWEPL